MSQEYLHSIRSHEIDVVLDRFPPPDSQTVRILEIGAGTGHQARRLAKLGYEVIAIDVSSSAYADERVYPICDYDGHHIPVASQSVDVVFSSNVLEHVPHIDELLRETARVLGPGGIAIHVLPTPSWRWWTSFTHYGWVISRLIATVRGRHRVNRPCSKERAQSPDAFAVVKTALWPPRHGERGNTLTEAYYFSRAWWLGTFREAGFQSRVDFPVGLFYTGSMLAAERLSLRRRKAMARWLGSSCRVYVLDPTNRSTEKDYPAERTTHNAL